MAPRGVLRRYLLLQVPGWILAALILAGLCRWADLPPWAALGAYALYVGKDFLLYPFLRHAYEPESCAGVERLSGERGIAETELNPEGFVRVRGELWRAQLEPSSAAVHPGEAVVVVSGRGMTLIVRKLQT
jgi:membrane-bound serine protease (ClpP class)